MNKELIDTAAVGSAIRKARQNRGYTQDRLAKEIDVTPAFVGHIERGDRSLSLETLVKVASILNISLDELLLGKSGADEDDGVCSDFRQLISGKSTPVQQMVLDVVRTLLNHVE